MTDSLTVGEARDEVLERLDDQKGRRYAPEALGGARYQRIDRALRTALDRCVDDYAVAGGDRLDEEVAKTTSASTGSCSLLAERPAVIRWVTAEPSTSNLYPLEEADKGMGGLPDLSERDLRLRFVRRFRLAASPAASDVLVAVDGVEGTARSWPAFDEWVCVRAALLLGTKDKEGTERLGELSNDLASAAIGQPRTPSSYPWPMPDNRSRLLRRLRWSFTPSTFTLQLLFDPLWRW